MRAAAKPSRSVPPSFRLRSWRMIRMRGSAAASPRRMSGERSVEASSTTMISCPSVTWVSASVATCSACAMFSSSLYIGTTRLIRGRTAGAYRHVHCVRMRDGLIATLLGVCTALSRLPFVADRLWEWDSVLYARALEHGFHVDAVLAGMRPHPPGYIFYVGAADVAKLVGLDSDHALVAVSVLAS